MEELAARRNALDTERRALEEEEERVRAAVVAAGAERDEVEAKRKQAEAELARARSEVEAAREKDSLVLPHTHQLPNLFLIVAIMCLLCTRPFCWGVRQSNIVAGLCLLFG